MTDLSILLSEAEFKFLDQFLLDRVDEDIDTEGKDEGVLDISELDGLFTAIVSGPVMVPPSQWLPVVWGDFEPVWEDEKAFEKILSLMMRHMNCIAATFVEHPNDYEPVFLGREIEGKSYAIVDEWCEGYRRGVGLAQDAWDSSGNDMRILLAPIIAFTAETDWRGHDFSIDEVENIQQTIAPNVQEIHAYWLARREENMPSSQPLRRGGPRVGRNDPCPCGSGKKYKKCCLH